MPEAIGSNITQSSAGNVSAGDSTERKPPNHPAGALVDRLLAARVSKY
jgi:hypothetical protein